MLTNLALELSVFKAPARSFKNVGLSSKQNLQTKFPNEFSKQNFQTKYPNKISTDISKYVFQTTFSNFQTEVQRSWEIKKLMCSHTGDPVADLINITLLHDTTYPNNLSI